MPITSHSTIGPMEQVWSLGWLVNRLLSRRPSAFTVVGVWFLALPWLVVMLTVPVTVISATLVGGVSNTLAGVVSLLVGGCYLLLATRVTLSYFRHRPHESRDP